MRVLHALCKGQPQEICCVPLRAPLLQDLVDLGQWSKKGALEICRNSMLLAPDVPMPPMPLLGKASASMRWVPKTANCPTTRRMGLDGYASARGAPTAKPIIAKQSKPRALSRSRLPITTNGEHGSGSH